MLSKVLVLLLFVTSLCYADESGGGKMSKEDKRFESQGKNVLIKLIEEGLLGDGRFITSYSSMWRNGNVSENIDFSIETRVVEEYFGRNCNSNCDKNMILPIEMTLRADISDKTHSENGIGVENIRAGLVRMVAFDSGLTLQPLSYILNNNKDFDSGTFHGAEIVDIIVSDVIDLSKDGSIELLVKLRANFAIGVVSNNKTLESFDKKGFVGGDNALSVKALGSASVGVRIKKKIIMEFFGGVEYFNDSLYGFDTPDSETSKNIADSDKPNFLADVIHTSTGAGLKYSPIEYLHLGLILQRDTFMWDGSFLGTRYKSTHDGKTGLVTFELRW